MSGLSGSSSGSSITSVRLELGSWIPLVAYLDQNLGPLRHWVVGATVWAMATSVFVVEPVCDAHVVDTIVRPHFSGVLGDRSYRHQSFLLVSCAALDGVAKLPEWRASFVGVRHVCF